MILAQESGKVILARVDADENNHEVFDNFAVVVMDKIMNKMNSAAVVCEFSERDEVVQVPPNPNFRAAKALE